MLKKEIEYPNIISQLQTVVENFTKDYGHGSITTLEENENKNLGTLSTGSVILDQTVGGGYAFGRIVEIYGQEASGKTTLALHAVSECQKLGKKVAYIDLENALSKQYVKNIGIKTSELLIVYPKSGEEALDMVARLVEANIDLIVIDSVAALIPKAELEADLEKQAIGSQARMMSAGLRKINAVLTNKSTIVVFINQIRNKINTSFFAGNPETTTGGKALGYFASLRISLKVKERIVDKLNRCIGVKIQAKIIKNKLASPYQEAYLEIIFSRGIQKAREILDLAVEREIIHKSGNWYSYQGKKVVGREAIIDHLISNSSICDEIEKLVIEKPKSRDTNNINIHLEETEGMASPVA